MTNFCSRSIRLVGGVLVVYALLVATHLGEFWPFSIYPMFSQAGHPWSRSVVRELPAKTDAAALNWKAQALSDLPGRAYPLVPRGVNQNDVANYLSKTPEWTPDRIKGLRDLLTRRRDSLTRPLLVVRAEGRLVADTVSITAVPVLLFTADTTHLNPSPAARVVPGGRPLADAARPEPDTMADPGG